MRIIERYLLRQFLQTFTICFLSLAGVYIIFDAFTNLDAFMRCARGAQLLKLMAGYYSYQTFFFFDRTSSLLVLMSAMFTVAWIQRHQEMTALMAAGISRIRIVKPVIVAAVAITFLAAINREVFIPKFKEQLAQRPADLRGNVVEELYPLDDYTTDVIIGGKHAIVDQQKIESPDFVVPMHRPSLCEYGKRWVAIAAFYQNAHGDRPAGYLMDCVLEPTDLAKKPSLLLDGKPVLITPHDRPDWIAPHQAFVVSDVTIDQLTGARTFKMFSSTWEMIRAIRSRSYDFGADIRVSIHSRIVQPLLDLTLLFLGLPLVVSKERRNVFVAIGLCMGVVTLFLIVAIGCQQLGNASLFSPAFASWMPLMVFVPAAVGISESMWER